MSSTKRSRATFESDASPPQHAPFALYGTPLPAYDADSRDDGSYVPVWKQEVTDERGRKRLHGAFTGGFSAGYFNTVGSKQGWAPATFVSSRANRAKKGDGEKEGSRVEDFMDEEDLAEREEQMKLETQGGFAGLGGGGGGEGGAKGMFGDLFRAEGETMGVKLLQRMGWKRAQGVGPKVKRMAKGDKSGEVHLFAPENTGMVSFERKTDRKGLGLVGEEKLGSGQAGVKDGDEDSDQDARILKTSRKQISTKPRKLKQKSSFGVGVLNDTGSDDEDPYAIGPQINYNRIIGGDKKQKRGGLLSSNASSNVQKPVIASNKSSKPTLSAFRKCHDGRLPLEGFILATATLTLQDENRYPPPTVPEYWTPSRLSQPTSAIPANPTNSNPITPLDPKARATLLGETPLPGKSIFDYLSPSARDSIANATNKPHLPQGRGEGAPAGYVPTDTDKRRTLWDLVPDLDRATAEAALARGTGGWMPYAEDEDKRHRYRKFLELKAGRSMELPQRNDGMSTGDWTRELTEFTRAAEAFRPVKGVMAARFTSSSSSTPRLASDAPDSAGEGQKQKEQDPAEKAAGLGLYGPLTRSRLDFFPTRLLCKRFNVKPPASVSSNDVGNAGTGNATARGDGGSSKELVSRASLRHMMVDAEWHRSKQFARGGTEGGHDHKADESGVGVPQRVKAEENAALEGKRAGEAVFKAIFGDDSSDED